MRKRHVGWKEVRKEVRKEARKEVRKEARNEVRMGVAQRVDGVVEVRLTVNSRE